MFNSSSSPPQINAYEELVANQYGAISKKLFRSPVKHAYNSVNKPKQSIKISKVDISSFANNFDLVPDIKGFSKTVLLQLYVAKCQDLKINATKQQMVRFFDIIKQNHPVKNRKLNFCDCGLGDASLHVVAKLLKKNTTWASVDLSKNDFSNEGLKVLAETLRDYNSTVVHLSLGGNHIGTEGTMHLFQCLKNHPSLVSLNLANTDCYKNKIKIGHKSAEALKVLLESPGCLLTHLNLTDNAMTSESLISIFEGVSHCPSLISLDLTQNDLSTNSAVFSKLLGIFNEKNALHELVLSQSMLNDRNIEDLAACLQAKRNPNLQRLNLSANKITYKGAQLLLQAMVQRSAW